MKGMNGEDSKSFAYVSTKLGSTAPTQFFATEVHFGKDGVKKLVDVQDGPTSDYEKKLLAAAIEGLTANIEQAREYLAAHSE